MSVLVARLRTVLRANATFSSLCALATLLGASALALEIGLRAGELRGLGIQLLIFAAFLLFLSTRRGLGSGWTYWAVLALGVVDLLWVAGTAQVLSSGALSASPAGVWMAVGVAIVVGAFGVVELWIWWGLRRARGSAGTVSPEPAGP